MSRRKIPARPAHRMGFPFGDKGLPPQSSVTQKKEGVTMDALEDIQAGAPI